MSKKPKCPEMIGYVGDVRMLSEPGYVTLREKNIFQWARRSNSVNCAILFYSLNDVWGISQKKQKLLSMNRNLQIRQITDIQEFIDYIYTGRDRTKHPVQEIEMINVQSTWDMEPIEEYISTRHHQHAENKRTIHNVLLNNESVEIYAKSAQMTTNELGDLWKVSKDIEGAITSYASNIKGVYDNRKLNPLEKANKVVNEYREINFKIKTGDKHLGNGVIQKGSIMDHVKKNINLKNVDTVTKALGKVNIVYEAYSKGKDFDDAYEKFQEEENKLKKIPSFDKCIKDANDFNSPNFGNSDRCIDISTDKNKKSVINLLNFATHASGNRDSNDTVIRKAGLK